MRQKTSTEASALSPNLPPLKLPKSLQGSSFKTPKSTETRLSLTLKRNSMLPFPLLYLVQVLLLLPGREFQILTSRKRVKKCQRLAQYVTEIWRIF